MPVGPQRSSRGWKSGKGAYRPIFHHRGPTTMESRESMHQAGESLTRDIPERHLETWSGPHGYSGEVEASRWATGGMEHETYRAGPFRTNFRAQIAAEALSNRVEGGGGEGYHTGSEFSTFADLRGEG